MTSRYDRPPAELRVHGVGGPQGPRMLGYLDDGEALTLPPFVMAPDSERPDGWTKHDRDARCDLPRNGETRFVRRIPDDETEAYEWGGLTTGSWVKALWVVYLPFTVINAAGWAHAWCAPSPAKRPFLVGVHQLLVRVLAYLATITYVAWFAFLVLEVLAVRWPALASGPRRQPDTLTHDFFETWLPVLAPIAFVVVVLAILLSPGRRARFEEVGAADDEPWPQVPRIGARSFFAHADAHRAAWWRHVIVGLVAAAVFLGLHIGADTWFADRYGLVLVAIAAVQTTILVPLVFVDIVARLRSRLPDEPSTRGQGGGRYPAVRWLPIGAAFALLGTAMTHAAFAGFAMQAVSLLERWPAVADGADATPEYHLDAGRALAAADVLGWGLIILAALLVLFAIHHLTRTPPERSQGALVRMTRRVPPLVGLLVVALLLPVFGYAAFNQDLFNCDAGWLRPECATGWYDVGVPQTQSIFQRIGGLALLALVGGVFLVLRGPYDTGLARAVGQIWDVLTFWPRRYHPLGAPPSAERSVPEIRARVEDASAQRVTAGATPLVLVGHSQGSVLEAAALASSAALDTVRWVTFGSPLGTLYLPVWPAYVQPLLAELAAASTSGSAVWINFWRATDPVGACVPGAFNVRLDDPVPHPAPRLSTDPRSLRGQKPAQEPGPDDDDPVGRLPAERSVRPGTEAGHSHYLADPTVRRTIEELRMQGAIQ